ncbi:hypothetical protein ACFX12_013269 [Malus domestica]
MPDTMIEECMGLNANHFIFGVLSCFKLHVHHDWIDISAYGSTVVKYANLFFSKLTTLSMVFFSAMVLAFVRPLPLVASITNLHCIPSMSSMITNEEMLQSYMRVKKEEPFEPRNAKNKRAELEAMRGMAERKKTREGLMEICKVTEPVE